MMQTVAMLHPAEHASMYDGGVYAAESPVLRQEKSLRSPQRGLGSGAVVDRSRAEWNNGDPPDLMLWGEE